jgi:hypothetical protein
MSDVLWANVPEGSSPRKGELIFSFILEDFEVPSANRWNTYHWGKKAKMQAGWWMAIRATCYLNRAGMITFGNAGPRSFRMVRTLHRRRHFVDSDNLTSATKTLIIDVLRKECTKWVKGPDGKRIQNKTDGLGLIYDDDLKHCYVKQPEQEKISRKMRPSIEVFIYE